MRNPFTINYCDKEAVISYAKALGEGMTVFKKPGRYSYNITHTERTDRYEPDWVVYQS